MARNDVEVDSTIRALNKMIHDLPSVIGDSIRDGFKSIGGKFTTDNHKWQNNLDKRDKTHKAVVERQNAQSALIDRTQRLRSQISNNVVVNRELIKRLDPVNRLIAKSVVASVVVYDKMSRGVQRIVSGIRADFQKYGIVETLKDQVKGVVQTFTGPFYGLIEKTYLVGYSVIKRAVGGAFSLGNMRILFGAIGTKVITSLKGMSVYARRILASDLFKPITKVTTDFYLMRMKPAISMLVDTVHKKMIVPIYSTVRDFFQQKMRPGLTMLFGPIYNVIRAGVNKLKLSPIGQIFSNFLELRLKPGIGLMMKPFSNIAVDMKKGMKGFLAARGIFTGVTRAAPPEAAAGAEAEEKKIGLDTINATLQSINDIMIKKLAATLEIKGAVIDYGSRLEGKLGNITNPEPVAAPRLDMGALVGLPLSGNEALYNVANRDSLDFYGSMHENIDKVNEYLKDILDILKYTRENGGGGGIVSEVLGGAAGAAAMGRGAILKAGLMKRLPGIGTAVATGMSGFEGYKEAKAAGMSKGLATANAIARGAITGSLSFLGGRLGTMVGHPLVGAAIGAAMGDGIGRMSNALGSKIGIGMYDLMDSVSTTMNGIGSRVGIAAFDMQSGIAKFFGSGASAYDLISNKFESFLGGKGTTIKDVIFNLLKGFLMGGLIGSVAGGLKTLMGGGGAPAAPPVPKADKGGMVAKTGIAVIHAGETITPKVKKEPSASPKPKTLAPVAAQAVQVNSKASLDPRMTGYLSDINGGIQQLVAATKESNKASRAPNGQNSASLTIPDKPGDERAIYSGNWFPQKDSQHR